MIDLIQANIAAKARLHSSEEHFGVNKMLDSLFLLLGIECMVLFLFLPLPDNCIPDIFM